MFSCVHHNWNVYASPAVILLPTEAILLPTEAILLPTEAILLPNGAFLMSIDG